MDHVHLRKGRIAFSQFFLGLAVDHFAVAAAGDDAVVAVAVLHLAAAAA